MQAPSRAGRGKAAVAEALALRILGGDYPPARPLPNEAALLAEFGVSRTCLREALQMLAAKGLVRSRPKLGTFVREPHDWNFLDADILRLRQRVVPKPVFLRELFAVRRMVEPETAALSAVNATPAMLAKMQIAVLDMARDEQRPTRGDYTRRTSRSIACFSPRAATRSSPASAPASRRRCAPRSASRRTPTSGSRFALDKHLAVFEAVCDGNPGAARNNMIALLDMTEEVLERAKYGEILNPRRTPRRPSHSSRAGKAYENADDDREPEDGMPSMERTMTQC